MDYLSFYNKTLPGDLQTRALEHPLACNPLFIRTLAEELRLFGSHEALSDRLDHYLQSSSVDDLFERVLERVEEDCGIHLVRKVMTALWASRSGLTETEIRAFAALSPATWAAIRYGLNDALLESGGRFAFAHDYLRIAVSDRYLAGNGELGEMGQGAEAITLRREAHTQLAKWFEDQFAKADHDADTSGRGEVLVVPARAAEEIPYQWQAACAWDALKACLTRREMFQAIYANRSNVELLGYWLASERHTGSDLESDYEQAWAVWNVDSQDAATEQLAYQLSSFLRNAGRYRQFTTRIARKSLDISEKIREPESPYTGKALNNLAG